MPCYSCESCNFVMCEGCVKLDLFVSREREKNWNWAEWFKVENKE
jgi:hypothetical protein